MSRFAAPRPPSIAGSVPKPSRSAPTRHGCRARLAAVAVVAAACCGGTVPPAAAAPVVLRDLDGLHVISSTEINPRLTRVQLTTTALPTPTNLFILVPKGYDPGAKRRYPVLYLMHGATGQASDWTTLMHAQDVIGERQVITIMPDITLDGAGSGWCIDWANAAQRWETYHIGQLLPFIDHNLRTIPTRAGRAIVGLSEGGFCSMSYAARHPDLFAQADAYSGVTDLWEDDGVVRQGAIGVVNSFEVGDGLAPYTVFGSPMTNGFNWAANDPATLAENLRDTTLRLAWGNGAPGPLDSPEHPPANLIGEPLADLDNSAFQRRLNTVNIPVNVDAYGAGTHSSPYWERDLRGSIDKIMARFDTAGPPPTAFSYLSARNTFGMYDWSVTMRRTERDFSRLKVAGRQGFQLLGSGVATVTTCTGYRPGARYRVRVERRGTAPTTNVLVADRAGRLTVDGIDLGPTPLDSQQRAGMRIDDLSATDSETTVAFTRIKKAHPTKQATLANQPKKQAQRR